MTEEEKGRYDFAVYLWKESAKQNLPEYYEGDFSARLKWCNEQLRPEYKLCWDPGPDGKVYIQLRKNMGIIIDCIENKEETK